MIDDPVIYTAMIIMFFIILLLVGWLTVLTRMVYIKNMAMDEDLTDLEASSQDNFHAILRTNERIDGLISDGDATDFVDAMNEAAIRTRPTPHDTPEVGGDDVVYVTGR